MSEAKAFTEVRDGDVREWRAATELFAAYFAAGPEDEEEEEDEDGDEDEEEEEEDEEKSD